MAKTAPLCWHCGQRPRAANQILCEPCFEDATQQITRSIQDLKEGRVRPWAEVRAELGIEEGGSADG